MSERWSRAQVGQFAGISERAVGYAIARGDIKPGPDGRLTRLDADLLRRTARFRAGGAGANAALVNVRVHALAVKVKEMELRFKRLQSRSVERDLVAAGLDQAADRVLGRLGTWAERYAEVVAAELEINIDEATAVLRAFSDHALSELGDIRAEGAETLRRL
jgi:hypothetical protein